MALAWSRTRTWTVACLDHDHAGEVQERRPRRQPTNQSTLPPAPPSDGGPPPDHEVGSDYSLEAGPRVLPQVAGSGVVSRRWLALASEEVGPFSPQHFGAVTVRRGDDCSSCRAEDPAQLVDALTVVRQMFDGVVTHDADKGGVTERQSLYVGDDGSHAYVRASGHGSP